MIEFKNVFLKSVAEYYSLYDFSIKINSNICLIGEQVYTSSIARILSKIEKHYQGDVLLNNINIKLISDKNLNVAYVAKTPFLFNNKTARKNIEYSLKIRKFDKKYIENIINSLIFSLNLNFLDKKAKTLTYNEKIICSLLRAIIWKPKYLILENLMENLDIDHCKLVDKILNFAKQNSTIIALENQLKYSKFYNFEVKEI